MTLRILIVDDDPDGAEVLSLYLASHGFETTTAHEVDQAIARILSDRPDVVITDIHFDRGSGHDVARFARQRGCGVIALSGDSSEAAEFDHVLIKPCPPRRIAMMVIQVAGRAARLQPVSTV